MTHAHYSAIICHRSDLQVLGQIICLCRKGMVSHCFARVRESFKDGFPVMKHLGNFPMHWTNLRATHVFKGLVFPECLADGLMSKADPENGDFSRKSLDDWNHVAGFVLRVARARRDEDLVGLLALDPVHSHIVPLHEHFGLRAELADIIYQVIDETVLIVDEKDFLLAHFSIPSAMMADFKALVILF